MRIERRFLVPHLHAAAVDQLVAELRRDGYEVARDVATEIAPGRRAVFDVMAQRQGEKLFYEVKVLGAEPRPDGRLRDLGAAAQREGGDFRLLLVRPEPGVEVSVAGLEAALARAVAAQGDALLAPLGGAVTVREIAGTDIRRIHVHPGGTAVEGEAVLRLSRGNEQAAIPFHFAVTLDERGEVAAEPAPVLALDLADWDGWDVAA